MAVDFKVNRDSKYNGPQDFLPVCENIEIESEMVSDIQQGYIHSSSKANRRLTQTFYDKEDYVLNYIYLKYLIEKNVIKDVVLKKCLAFNQNYKLGSIMENLRQQRVDYRAKKNKTMADTTKL